MNYKCSYESPIGRIILTGSGEKLTGLFFENTGFIDEPETADFIMCDNREIFVQTKEWLNRYFNGEKPNPDEIPLERSKSDFCMTVRRILKEIPYGKTVTYGEIAQIIAKEKGIEKMSARAVGRAVGHNPVLIIVPCHRVIGADGKLTGYSAGTDKKAELLKLENADVKGLYISKKGNDI